MLLLLVFSTGPMIKQDCVFKNEIIENIKDLKHLRTIFQVQSPSKKPKKLKKKTTTTNKQQNKQGHVWGQGSPEK